MVAGAWRFNLSTFFSWRAHRVLPYQALKGAYATLNIRW